MKTVFAIILPVCMALSACVSTKFMPYEAANNVFEGKGGTREVVDGIDMWNYGEPPRKYRVIGIIEDSRYAGPVNMAMRSGDLARKAKESGGQGIIRISEGSQITGASTTGAAFGAGNSAFGSSSTMMHRNASGMYAVIQYVQ